MKKVDPPPQKPAPKPAPKPAKAMPTQSSFTSHHRMLGSQVFFPQMLLAVFSCARRHMHEMSAYVDICICSYFFLSSQFFFLLTPTVLNRHLCAAQLFRLFRRLWNVRSSAHVHVTDDVWSTAHVWSAAHVTVWSSRISLNDLPPPRFRSF